jgi:hypothetical protein
MDCRRVPPTARTKRSLHRRQRQEAGPTADVELTQATDCDYCLASIIPAAAEKLQVPSFCRLTLNTTCQSSYKLHTSSSLHLSS